MRHGGVVLRALVVLWFSMACFPLNLATAALTLQSSFSVSAFYTDNLFFNDQNIKSDYGTLLGPDFILKYDNPDIVIGGTYFGRMALLVENPSQSRYIQNANIILDLPFLAKRYKGLTVTIDETMNFTPQLDAFAFSGARNTLTSGGRGGAGGEIAQTSDPQGGGGTQGVFTSRADAFYNSAGITLAYAWKPQLTPTLGYTNQYIHFFDGDFQDSITHIGNLSLPYTLTKRTTVTAFYTYRQTDYTGKATPNSSGDKLIVHSPQLGISYLFTPDWRGFMRAGVAFTKENNAVQFVGGTQRDLSDKWQTNGVGSVGLVKKYRLGFFGVDASQTIGGGGGLSSGAALSQVITGRIGHSFTARLNAFGSLGYARNKSTEGDALNTNTYIVQGGLGYTFLRWLRGNIGYSHIDQRSTGTAAGDIRVDSFFLTLSAFADPWIWFR